jgi:hypothetical protein
MGQESIPPGGLEREARPLAHAPLDWGVIEGVEK